MYGESDENVHIDNWKLTKLTCTKTKRNHNQTSWHSEFACNFRMFSGNLRQHWVMIFGILRKPSDVSVIIVISSRNSQKLLLITLAPNTKIQKIFGTFRRLRVVFGHLRKTTSIFRANFASSYLHRHPTKEDRRQRIVTRQFCHDWSDRGIFAISSEHN